MPIEDVRKCFSVIPNWGGTASYDYWLRLGMSAHAASGGSGEALDARVEWSGFRDAAVCRSKWRTFGGGSITAGTLVFEARQHDPDLRLAPRPAPSEERLRAALLAMKRKRR